MYYIREDRPDWLRDGGPRNVDRNWGLGETSCKAHPHCPRGLSCEREGVLGIQRVLLTFLRRFCIDCSKSDIKCSTIPRFQLEVRKCSGTACVFSHYRVLARILRSLLSVPRTKLDARMQGLAVQPCRAAPMAAARPERSQRQVDHIGTLIRILRTEFWGILYCRRRVVES